MGDRCVSRIAHTDIGLAHTGVGRVDGLREGGDLSEVAIRTKDVRLLAGHRWSGESRMSDRISRSNGIRSLADRDQSANNDELSRVVTRV